MSQTSVKATKATKPKYVKVVKDAPSDDKTTVKVAVKVEAPVAKADNQAKADMKTKKVKVYATYVNIPAKYASAIIGHKASVIKAIEKEVGNNTHMYYETEKEAVSITSNDKESLKMASLKVLSLVDEAKKKEAIKKQAITKNKKSFNIHPDILKANLVYQVIGPKGAYIQEMINTVGRGCNIVCSSHGQYMVEAESKNGLNMAYDLLMKRERIILTNPDNKETIDYCRGYRLIKNKKGKQIIEYIGQEHSLIDVYKKKETVRYWLSKNKNIPLYEVEEADIEEEYKSFYKIKEEQEEPQTFDLEKLKEEMKSAPAVATVTEINTVWNNTETVNSIKDELPEITAKLNVLHYKLQKQKLESLEDEVLLLDLSQVMDYDGNESDEDEDENEVEYMSFEDDYKQTVSTDELPEFTYEEETTIEEPEYDETDDEEYYEDEYDDEEDCYDEEPVRMSDAWDN